MCFIQFAEKRDYCKIQNISIENIEKVRWSYTPTPTQILSLSQQRVK